MKVNKNENNKPLPNAPHQKQQTKPNPKQNKKNILDCQLSTLGNESVAWLIMIVVAHLNAHLEQSSYAVHTV